MNHYPIKILENIIQLDLGRRGIHSDPNDNLCIRAQENLLNSAKRIAEKPGATIGIVTGFYIPHGHPPAPETDGPIGALALARGLNLLGYKVLLITDCLCIQPLLTAIEMFSHQMRGIQAIEFPFEVDDLNNQFRAANESNSSKNSQKFVDQCLRQYSSLEFLISIERVGPCHNLNSFLNQAQNRSTINRNDFKKYGPGKLADQCLSMKGEPVTAHTAKIHLLYEFINEQNLSITTIGIGDGGNEIGMGSIPWDVIHKNIRNGLGGKIACRIPTDYTIVAGVSNWGGYALLAAVCILLKKPSMFNIITETTETQFMGQLVTNKLAVDGILGHPNMSMDGIDWEIHLAILKLISSQCH